MLKLERPMCPNPKALQSDYKHPANKDALIGASFGKCMYCEKEVISVSFGDVEHIKPKSKYPDLEFEWTNLGFACPICNNSKRAKYDEECPYVNPYEESPSSFLTVFGTLISGIDARGKKTVIDMKLNRTPLQEKRLEKLKELEKIAEAYSLSNDPAVKNVLMDLLRSFGSTDKDFSFFVQMWVQEMQLA